MLLLTALAALAVGGAEPPAVQETGQQRHDRVTAEVASGKVHYYPDKALAAGVSSGRAVLDCLVEEGMWLTDCKVASEEPTGYDFGAAALKMAPLFKMKPQPDPTKQPAAGVRVQIPISFRLPT